MAVGTGEVLRPGGGGRMAGAEPAVDGTGAGPQARPYGADGGEVQGRQEWDCHVEIE